MGRSVSTKEDVDALARNMVEWARMGRQMPPSFESDGVSHRVASPSGGDIGRILPGRGFICKAPLKRYGIRRHIPGVYDPDMYRFIEDGVRKRVEALASGPKVLGFRRDGRPIFSIEGAAISTYDQIIQNRASGKANDIAVFKANFTTTANVWYSTWHAAGMPPAGTFLATTAPTDANLDGTNAAAISKYLSNPGATDDKYILTFGFAAAQQVNMCVLVDIINHGGSFRLSVNTAETVTTPTITGQRQYGTGSGVGNLLTFVVTTAGTPGAGTFIAQYVDQAGANTNAPTLNTAAAAIIVEALFPSTVGLTAGQASFFIPLASGSTGVQAVKQTTCSVAGTGVIASNVFFPLLMVPGVAANSYLERDSTTQIDGITQLQDVAQQIGHVALYVLTNTTSTGGVLGYMKTVSG